MAIDQRDVSSTLRFMKDDVLQQYAAMHKNDPYIFPLAFQESQNRQRLRMNQQAAQGMQPQPKVNEQALAQMAPQQLPEDQGIATLAAPNMQQMADGGIAGYDDADFVSRSEPVVMMAGGGVARYNGAQGSAVSLNAIESKYQKELQEVNTGARVQYSPDVQEYVNLRAQTSPDNTPVQVNPIPNAPPQASARPPLGSGLSSLLYSNITPKERARFDKLQAEKQATALKTPFEQERTANMAEIAKGSTYTPEAYSVTKPAPLFADAQRSQTLVPSADKTLKDDTERKDTGRKDTGRKDTKPAAEPARKEPVQATTDAMGMFNQALEKADRKPNPLKTELEAINAAKVKAGEENVKGLEAINKQFADINKGKKDRLDTREGEIAKMKDQSLGLALLNAGARMMQTRGSIGEAIGAGIDTGSKQYVAGLDKINAAKDKLSDARDRLEELEAQRGEMSAREMHKARNEVKALTVSGMENLVQAAMAERKMNRAEAIAFVEQQIKVSEGAKDRASREGIADIEQRGQSARSAAQIAATLNTPDRVLFDQLMKKNGNDAVKALAAFKVAKGDNFDVRTLYADYIKDAAKSGMPVESLATYAARFGATLPR
jgi:hypothetical protein